MVHVALVVHEHLKRHGELPVHLVERLVVLVLAVGRRAGGALGVEHVGKGLELIDDDKVFVLGEEIGVLFGVGKRVVADGELLVAELLVQLDPVEEHVVVVDVVRLAEKVAVRAQHGAASFRLLRGAFDAHLEWMLSAQVLRFVNYKQTNAQLITDRHVALAHIHTKASAHLAHQFELQIERCQLEKINLVAVSI